MLITALFLIACTGLDDPGAGGREDVRQGTEGSPGEPAPPPPGEPLPLVIAAVLDGRATDDQAKAWEAFLAGREENAGPHLERIYLGYSPDGYVIDLTDRELIRSKAAVPDAVIGADGRTYLYFVEGDFDRSRALVRARDPWMRTHGLLGLGGIDLIVRGDGGTWEPVRDFAVEGIIQGMIVDPVVRTRPEGGWRLYYLGVGVEDLLRPNAWADGSPHTVYSALSSDLVHWKQEGLVVQGPNADPAVWCDGDWCVMISTGLDRSESTDGGKTFTFQGPIGVPGFAPAFLDLPDGRVRLFYNTKDRGGALRSMISTDRGRTWTKEPRDRVPPYTLEAPSFLPAPQGGWWVYYHYWQEGISPDMFEAGFQRKQEGNASPGGGPPPPGGPPPRGGPPPPGGPPPGGAPPPR